jgi:ATP-binding cassette, subfamily A (ABC1), member 3
LGIESYGVSLTTLEDVFLRIGDELGEGHQNKKKKEQESALTKNQNSQQYAKNDEIELEQIREKNPSKIFWMHFGALIRKRFIYIRRDFKGLLCEIFIPILIIWLGFAVTKV